ncbi:MAG: PTS sugar transporter subunit IIA [Fusobacteria bacterium]|nr:PTS sugar transporter subunit IIA [Fusobacteriota bacterium]
MTLESIISEKSVVLLETTEMEDTINIMIDKALDLGKIKSKEEFLEAILEREEIVSTGIGLGVAIPHAKLKSIDNFFIILGLTKSGLDWDAIDRKPVKAVFLIGGPENKQQEYLKIVSRIMLLVKNNEKREILFNENSYDQIKEIFSNF